MPLFLRALPLSLMTLWHYVFVLPLVLIVAMPFVLLALIPILGLPVMLVIVTFITFAGYRCALAAFGRGNEPDFGRLVKASFSWGIINTFGSVLMMIIAAGVGYGLGFLGLPEPDWVPATFVVPYAGPMAAAVYLVLITLFTCAVAVPMTAVAHTATRNGPSPDPFFGFGAGTFSLLVVFLAWGAGYVYFGFFGTILAALTKGMLLLAAKVYEVPLVEEIEIDWIPLAIAVVYLLWGTCWFCATAVLAWDRRIQRRIVVETVIAQTPKISAEELRALRESRMRGMGEGG